MKGRIFAGLFLCSLFFVVGGDAQSPNIPEKPVWTLEFIKVQPENLAPAMQYLDDHWMRVRADARRQGAVLDYHIISNARMVTPGHKVSDEDSIVLLTKYKSMDAYLESTSAANQNGPIRYIVRDAQASGVRAKPATRGHFKTGHSRPGTLDVVLLARFVGKPHFRHFFLTSPLFG